MKRATRPATDNFCVISLRPLRFSPLRARLAAALIPLCTSPLPATAPRPAHPVTFRSSQVLLIGDSLTVGPFGDLIEEFLVRSRGEKNVFISAVCGSSPEHWIRPEPEFRSHCGFRFKPPSQKTILGRHENGHPPETRATQKIEDILQHFHPGIVIVQLGTNWFDRLEESHTEATRARIEGIIERFHATVSSKAPGAVLVWITPPDSSRFRSVQSTVTKAIGDVAKRRSFETINSSRMLTYIPGKSGGDGVHLAAPAAEQWFKKVRDPLQKILNR